MSRIHIAVVIAVACSASALRSDAFVISRRGVITGAAAATLPLRQAAKAFDLPPLEEFDNAAARGYAAKKPNPPLAAQQSKAFYAVSTGDVDSLCAAQSPPLPRPLCWP